MAKQNRHRMKYFMIAANGRSLTWRCSGLLDETKRADVIFAPLLTDPPAQSLLTTLKTSRHSEIVCDGGKANHNGDDRKLTRHR
jgi:hypothetical protein